MRKLTIAFLIIIILFTISASSEGKSQDKPNVIIVMTDDQGYGELSRHGNPVLKTPNLDQLAARSLRLTDYHAAPMCTPTRGQLMTGLDAARNGAINVSSGRTLLRPELSTMADIFADNGYQTGIFGKWHGFHHPTSAPYRISGGTIISTTPTSETENGRASPATVRISFLTKP